MYNDLIVMTFTRAQDALIAMFSLDMMRDRNLLGLGTATLLAVDKSGRFIINQAWELEDYPHSQEGRVPGGLARMLFGDKTGKGKQQLIKVGLDDIFLQNLLDASIPDSSVLFFYIPRESLVDTERLRKTLSRLRGTLYHTTFPNTAEETILQGLEYNAGASM